MKLARVTGTVVASAKADRLDGLRFLVLEDVDPKGRASGSKVVASDAVGAGVGEVVMYASGSSARQTEVTKDRPVDAVVMAIVDMVEEQGKASYDKSKDAG